MSHFDEFVGNREIVRRLQQALAADRLPHALIFTGQEGTGKRHLARHLAKALNCLERKADFCDTCRSCAKLNEDAHPDAALITLYFDDKTQKLKKEITIDQMRELKSRVYARPFEGRTQVYWIDPADKLSEEAQNSVLKMLEEPPADAVLILITAHANELLPTIRSRCQSFTFSPVSDAEVEAFLKSQEQFPENELRLRSRLARGSVGRALSLNLDEYRLRRDRALKLLEGALGLHDLPMLFEQVSSATQDRDSFEDELQVLYLLLDDLLSLKCRGSDFPIRNFDIQPPLEHLASRISIDWLAKTTERLDSIRLAFRRNINRAVALDDWLLSLRETLS